ncbi:VOC family protein [Nocardia sp. 348MFTsu5.1]|uniref:VOC family protein n=1 Tax=Nocardia sp. 348MFTsu5.1 TaxID=1172185 RepID=UPI000364CE34|nr:VOC family protein [Nocardia sp. 348MFTsu5.1]
MRSVNPYLNFNGNTEEVFTFYQSVFGGELQLVRFSDLDSGDMGLTAEQQNGVAHIALPLGDSVLMGSDVPEQMGTISAGTNFAVSVEVDSADEARQVFGGLSESGEVTMAPDKVEWAELFGMCTDKYGIQWMIGYTGDVEFGQP